MWQIQSVNNQRDVGGLGERAGKMRVGKMRVGKLRDEGEGDTRVFQGCA